MPFFSGWILPFPFILLFDRIHVIVFLISRSVSVLETISVLLVLDCLLLYSTYLSHAYTLSWDVVFSPLIGLSLLWLIVFLYIAFCHVISYYHLKVTLNEFKSLHACIHTYIHTLHISYAVQCMFTDNLTTDIKIHTLFF